MGHISNSSPAASVTCGHCALVNKKTKSYLTKEDVDIGSDLFFAELVKGKMIDRPVLTLIFGVGPFKNDSRTVALFKKNLCVAEFSTGGRIKNFVL